MVRSEEVEQDLDEPSSVSELSANERTSGDSQPHPPASLGRRGSSGSAGEHVIRSWSGFFGRDHAFELDDQRGDVLNRRLPEDVWFHIKIAVDQSVSHSG